MNIDRRAAAVVLLAVAVGLAFADSSIVMLGLPEIYGELDATIPGASFVITAYNLAVAVAAFVLIPVMRRVAPVPVLLAGLAIFAAASLGCGLAPTLPVLVAFRGVQGIGGAMLLAASLPALVRLAGGEREGRSIWALAGSAGAVVGPALGGVITELADWRAIFIVQAPVAAIALPALRDRRLRGLGVERDDGVRPPLWSQLGLVFAFGALVGALFLAV
ncbi:MAG TPA: MFS transporter, partial [Miltoncostaea sp.]|nr:MFS transporter [Miltoncostaea sp.]